MTHSITRRLHFDYGHRVLGHEGKCRHLHGHRGTVEITVVAAELDSLGMVVDFGAVKTSIGAWINQNWDHNMLLHKDDPLLAVGQEVFSGKEPFVLTENPTAENLARVLFDVALQTLPAPLRIVNVRFWETPDCYADYKAIP